MDVSPLSTLTPETSRRLRQLLAYARREGIPVERIDSAYRTCREQNALYASGVSPANGCRSWHTWGRAADLYITGAYRDPISLVTVEMYEALGRKWKEMGGGWGGDFPYKDMVHFEWHPEHESVLEICPTPNACPVGPPWPEDRPLYARPAAWASALAGGGVAAAWWILAKGVPWR